MRRQTDTGRDTLPTMTHGSYTSLRTAGVVLALVAVPVSCSSQSAHAKATVSKTTVASGSTSTARGGPDAVTSAVPITPTPTNASTYVAGAACVDGQVDISQPHPVPPDGQELDPFVVKNLSDVPCTLTGYVTVRLVDHIGMQIGGSGTHEPGPSPTITLRPHGANTATFQLHTKSSGGDCTESYFLDISLPGAASSTPPAYAGNIGVKVCDGYLGITPMAAG